jgi:hypothetical protein
MKSKSTWYWPIFAEKYSKTKYYLTKIRIVYCMWCVHMTFNAKGQNFGFGGHSKTSSFQICSHKIEKARVAIFEGSLNKTEMTQHKRAEIDVSKIIFNPVTTLHLVADPGAMTVCGKFGCGNAAYPKYTTMYTCTSKLPFKCIRMPTSFIYNTSLSHNKANHRWRW